MGTVAGHSAGFGRIGAEMRPSAYTPFHLSSAPQASSPTAARRRIGLRGWIVAGVVLVVVVTVAALAGLFVQSPQPAQPLEASSKRIQVLDAEAERLGRSAFARQRHRG
jgi:hypothetical protein